MGGTVEDHRQACDGFTEIAQKVNDRWGSPSPCPEWDARGVLEHVIGFHDVLLLKPLDAKPKRPTGDPVERWSVTVDALFTVLSQPGVLDDKASLISYLTTEVLVHTWDLASAIGVTVTLDPRLCRLGLDRALANGERMQSDMFATSFAVAEHASLQDRLLAAFGRDPAWICPS
jgi:uncharacterized protein (TIGR03086 family)